MDQASVKPSQQEQSDVTYQLQEEEEQEQDEKNWLLNVNDHKLSQKEMLEKYKVQSMKIGLSSEQVKEKQDQEGQNISISLEIPPLNLQIFALLKTKFTVLILVAIILSLAHFLVNKKEKYCLYIGLSLLIAKVMSMFLLFYRNKKQFLYLQYQRANKYKQLYSVIRDGKQFEVPCYQLVSGDIVLLTIGLEIPADIRILTCNNMKVWSVLTGENIAQKHQQSSNDNFLEAENILFHGSIIKQGVGVGIVIKTGRYTVLGQVSQMLEGNYLQLQKRSQGISEEIKLVIQILSFIAVVILILA